MNMRMEPAVSSAYFPYYGWIGIVGLAAFEALMLNKVEPFYTFFYLFAWWSFILVADAALKKLRGESYICDHPREFAGMAFVSAAVWFAYECANVRLNNWEYVNVPQALPARWAGYFFSYATVIPGMTLVARLLWELRAQRPSQDFFDGWISEGSSRCLSGASRALGLRTNARLEPRWENISFALGVLCLVLPMVWPLYFFPLIWGAAFFIFDPLAARAGAASFLAEISRGLPRRFFLCLLAGVICGGMWEFWNFWAGAKWVYTVPWVGRLKVFEMPVAGYIGFPPFAVSCFSFYAWFSAWLKTAPRYLPWLLAPAALVFDIIACRLIDMHTVVWSTVRIFP